MTIGQTVKAATSGAANAVQKRLTTWAIIALFVVTAFGLGTAALFMIVSAQLGPIWACVVLALAYGVVALIIALVVATRTARHEKADPARVGAPMADTDAIGHLIAVFAAAYRASRH